MKDEILDFYDEEMTWQGIETRGNVHRHGLWHCTFHCWVYRLEAGHHSQGPKREQGQEQERGTISLLFQKRHPQKDTWPGKLDVTTAGHLLAGETPADGVRELEEELGIRASLSDLSPIGVYSDVLREAEIFDREFCHVYALKQDQPLHAYRIQRDELTGLYWIELAQLEALLAGEIQAAEASGCEWLEDGRITASSAKVERSDLVPHQQHYYRQVLAAIKELASVPSRQP